MVVTSNVTHTDFVHSSGNPALPVIMVTSSLTDPLSLNAVVLDANGDGPIGVGGSFQAEADNGTAYADGVYTGTYDIDVSY